MLHPSNKYSKTCLKRPLKNRQNKDLMTNGSFMSILQYFWPAFSNNWSLKPKFGFLSEWPLKTGFTVSEYDQEMPQSQTNTKKQTFHIVEETQKNKAK